jgi:superfamily II DNA helicase RecQ
MQLKFFTIPVHGNDAAQEDLNRFLNAHRIVSVERSFVQDGANSAWALCVSYEPSGEGRPQSGKRGKVDYREVLSEDDFAVYARLRSLRREIAESEGVPVYSLFTNEQMAEMVTRRVSSAAALREIAGIGEARVEKYGKAFLQTLAEAFAAGKAPGDSGDAT